MRSLLSTGGVHEAQRSVRNIFSDTERANFISVWGGGSIVDDVDLKRKLWQKSLERWFENGPEDPEVALIKVTASRIQTWGRMGDHVID